jgi:hypothetical protein
MIREEKVSNILWEHNLSGVLNTTHLNTAADFDHFPLLKSEMSTKCKQITRERRAESLLGASDAEQMRH